MTRTGERVAEDEPVLHPAGRQRYTFLPAGRCTPSGRCRRAECRDKGPHGTGAFRRQRVENGREGAGWLDGIGTNKKENRKESL